MDSEIIETITEWETVPFSGGYGGLRELADDGFSGAVTQGSAWAFMLNGRLIGIAEGALSTFAEATGTAYEAPDPALPLLYAMKSRGGEKQAEYYTNKTPISEADATLSSGKFTGYIELSENVLSGDYYVVYYGGKSMSVAFVGNSRRLLTDDEAFARADDEVGIYDVYSVDIDIIDLPEADSSAEDSTTGNSTTGESASTDLGASIETDSDASVETDFDESAEDVSIDAAEPAATHEPPETATLDEAVNGSPGSEAEATEAGTAGADAAVDGETATGDAVESRTPADGEIETVGTPTDSSVSANGTTPSTDSRPPREPDQSTAESAAQSPSKPDDEDVFSEEAQWRNAKTIPSLDPSDDPKPATQTPDSSRQAARTQSKRKHRQRSQGSGRSGSLSAQQLRQRLKRAETIMGKAEERHAALIAERDAACTERDEARERVEALETELTEARAEIESLESQLAEAQSRSGRTRSSRTETMDVLSALDGTNLFVRYDSKGAATLEKAHAGTAVKAEVNENLRIDHHTTFESEGLYVDDEPFEAFLDARIEVAFANWIVRELLYEIRETSNQEGLRGVYDAIPKIDRIELRGTVELGTDEEGDQIERDFDVVIRDKMGDPLLVANFDESKHPVGGAMIESLIRDGGEVSETEDRFGGAFAVTTSYFDRDALEATSDATSGGLLSRNRGKSFVSLSRKRGFHLCLVDKLDSGFDLRVPEL